MLANEFDPKNHLMDETDLLGLARSGRSGEIGFLGSPTVTGVVGAGGRIFGFRDHRGPVWWTWKFTHPNGSIAWVNFWNTSHWTMIEQKDNTADSRQQATNQFEQFRVMVGTTKLMRFTQSAVLEQLHAWNPDIFVEAIPEIKDGPFTGMLDRWLA